ncbi:hypothetical protein ACS5PU_18390 [Pedobacter sp. GSP4]|uniref:hypothetical protein n=1 Tax=Pedobacter sp. GSP4 TaxID=3453716 RepID=UPI003EEC7A5A
MGDKRRGEVIHIDYESGLGTIIDENCQDIHFQLDDVSNQIKIKSKVIFEIELGQQGLAAVKVALENIEVNV